MVCKTADILHELYHVYGTMLGATVTGNYLRSRNGGNTVLMNKEIKNKNPKIQIIAKFIRFTYKALVTFSQWSVHYNPWIPQNGDFRYKGVVWKRTASKISA